MATTFLEPGGDADFAIASTNGFWGSAGGNVVTDFVHGNHVKSLRIAPSVNSNATTNSGILADTGSRISIYFYFVALPTTNTSILRLLTSGNSLVISIHLTSAGVLQLWNGAVAQIGTDGATLSTGKWYRISLAYTITSTSVNRFELFVDSVSSISITNATIATISTSKFSTGNISADVTLDFRHSDSYADNSSALTDTGNIWVTAKRPISNGSVNNFTTQIGSGGSGVGSGHAPQVNERALSKTNGWSMVGAGSAVTEEYTVQSASAGDIDISTATIVDWLAWVSADAAVGEIASIIAGGVSSTFTTPASPATRLVTKIVGSTTYPAGGTDVGIISDTSLTTLNLYECGVLIAYIPATPTPPTPSKIKPTLLMMGVG